MRLSGSVFRLGFLLIFVASLSYAATIKGTVKGPDGSPFEGAFVEAQNTKTRVTVSVLSHKDGQYQVADLPAGEYQLHIRAVGYSGVPRSGVVLTAEQNASYDFALQKGSVHWSDLSIYQGSKLFPELKGKQTFMANCVGCHGFQSRMAGLQRDEDGWRDRVNFMRQAVGVRLNDDQASEVTSYLTSLFSSDSVLPSSPADLPEYKALQQQFSDDAMKIVYVEYELPGPGRMPWDANPDKNGMVWMPYLSPVNGIGRLDPETGHVDEFEVPSKPTTVSFIHSTASTSDGSVWFTELGTNRLSKWDPATKQITEYQAKYTPGNQAHNTIEVKHTVRISPTGEIWMTGRPPLSRFDPKTATFTDVEIPKAPSSYGLAFDKDGNVWVAGFNFGVISKVDAKTLKVTTWDPPTPKSGPRRIQVDSNGIVWFGEYRAGKIGRFDPKTETFKEYQVPGGENSTPYALAVDRKNRIWYSSEWMDVLGCLNPDTGKITLYPFDHSDDAMRDLHLDAKGNIWYGTPANNKVGYFYLSEK